MPRKTRKSVLPKCSQVNLYEEFEKISNKSWLEINQDFKEIVDEMEVEIVKEANEIESLDRKVRRSSDYLNYEEISSRRTCDCEESEQSPEKEMLYQLNLQNLQLAVDQCLKTLERMQELRQEKISRFFGERNYDAEQLQEFLVQMAATLPLFPPCHQISSESRSLELVGGIPLIIDQVIPVGSFVAAYHDSLGSWVLARVKEIRDDQIYLLDDVEENKLSQRILQTARCNIVCLPYYRANPKFHEFAVFPVNSIVLALRHNTTCFYKGVIVNTPKGPTGTYRVRFPIDEQDEVACELGDTLDVHQMFVINLVKPKWSRAAEDRDNL